MSDFHCPCPVCNGEGPPEPVLDDPYPGDPMRPFRVGDVVRVQSPGPDFSWHRLHGQAFLVASVDPNVRAYSSRLEFNGADCYYLAGVASSTGFSPEFLELVSRGAYSSAYAYAAPVAVQIPPQQEETMPPNETIDYLVKSLRAENQALHEDALGRVARIVECEHLTEQLTAEANRLTRANTRLAGELGLQTQLTIVLDAEVKRLRGQARPRESMVESVALQAVAEASFVRRGAASIGRGARTVGRVLLAPFAAVARLLLGITRFVGRGFAASWAGTNVAVAMLLSIVVAVLLTLGWGAAHDLLLDRIERQVESMTVPEAPRPENPREKAWLEARSRTQPRVVAKHRRVS